MDRLPSSVRTSDKQYATNLEHNRAIVAAMEGRMKAVMEGGGGKYVERHRSRGKMLPRERIEAICDPGTAFLELSKLAANGLYDGNAHSAGIITGIGMVHGRECMFVANDATVKGGSYYPMTVSYTHLTLPTKRIV